MFGARTLILAALPALAALGCMTGTDSDDHSDSESHGPGVAMGNAPLNGPTDDAVGVTITEIALYQGVKRVLAGEGEGETTATPVIPGRDALVRVFTSTDDSYGDEPVTAFLFLGQAPPIKVARTIDTPSTDEDLASTFDFEVDGSALAAGVGFRVELHQPTGPTPTSFPAARYPAVGEEPLDVKADGGALKVVIVPIVYAADGSNRMPDLSEWRMSQYRNAYLGAYPVSDVEVTAHAPYVTNNAIGPVDQDAWNALLSEIAALRVKDDAADDVYYFGALEPAADFDTYCTGGCLEGTGMVGESPSDTYHRAAIGLGFPELLSRVAVHETGHNHGREHAPCGNPPNLDKNYPYAGGSTGVWGYDITTKALYSPSTTSDVMGYCDEVWVSDYTFDAFFDWIRAVNASVYADDLLVGKKPFDRARLEADGSLTPLPQVMLRKPPQSLARAVAIETASGVVSDTAAFYRFSHTAGGELLWPAPVAETQRVRVMLDGVEHVLER